MRAKAKRVVERAATGPQRTCVACRAVASPEEMLRVVLGPEGQLVPDLAGKSFGRGAWLHPACLTGSALRAFARSFKAEVDAQLGPFTAALSAAANRRIEGLLVAAAGSGKLRYGADDVALALSTRGAVALVLLAADARSAAKTAASLEAEAQGVRRTWGSKAQLGSVCGREEVALLALMDRRIAAAVRHTLELCGVVLDRAADGTHGLGTEALADDGIGVASGPDLGQIPPARVDGWLPVPGPSEVLGAQPDAATRPAQEDLTAEPLDPSWAEAEAARTARSPAALDGGAPSGVTPSIVAAGPVESGVGGPSR